MTTLSFRRRRTTRSARLGSCDGDTDRRRRWPVARSARESLDPPTTAYPTLPRVFGSGGPAHRAGLHAGQYHTSGPEARAYAAPVSHPRRRGPLHAPATIRDPRSCGGTRAGVHGETGLGVAQEPMPYRWRSVWPTGPTKGPGPSWEPQRPSRPVVRQFRWPSSFGLAPCIENPLRLHTGAISPGTVLVALGQGGYCPQ